jgi:hypothetical protein
MSNKKIISQTQFKAAVEKTKQVKDAYQKGLKALGPHSKKITLKDASHCEGSIDIDTTLASIYPNSNRWDYCFSYKGEAFFVEVHPANTSDVQTVINKHEWLKNWLRDQAPEIGNLTAKSRQPFYWIQTNGFHIIPHSRQFVLLGQKNIRLISRLCL